MGLGAGLARSFGFVQNSQMQEQNKKITQSRQNAQSMQTADIIKLMTKEQLEQKKQALQNYYVPYDAAFLEQGFEVEVFPANRGKTAQLAIKYKSEQDGIKQLQTIILASGDIGKVRIDTTKKQLNRFFGAELRKYVTLSGLEPERYIEYVQNMGWELTPEGWDIFSRTKSDDETQIKRTQFTNQELENISFEDIEQNSKNHTLRREQQIIHFISDYITKNYQKIGFEDIKELGIGSKEAQELKQKYEEVMKYAKGNKENRLAQLFETFKPISESNTKILQEAEEYIKPIRDYIQKIPSKYQDENQYEHIYKYLVIRFETIKQRDLEGENSLENTKLNEYIDFIDKEDEIRKSDVKLQMMNKVQTLINQHKQRKEMSL